MKKSEVAQMIDFAISCFPGAQIKDPVKMLNTWAVMFEHVESGTANNAMTEICKTNKYFPSVSDIMNEIKEEKDRMRGYVKC